MFASFVNILIIPLVFSFSPYTYKSIGSYPISQFFLAFIVLNKNSFFVFCVIRLGFFYTFFWWQVNRGKFTIFNSCNPPWIHFTYQYFLYAVSSIYFSGYWFSVYTWMRCHCMRPVYAQLSFAYYCLSLEHMISYFIFCGALILYVRVVCLVVSHHLLFCLIFLTDHCKFSACFFFIILIIHVLKLLYCSAIICLVRFHLFFIDCCIAFYIAFDLWICCSFCYPW